MFGKQKETKEEKRARKEQELLKRYGLEDVSPEYADALEEIASGLPWSSMTEFGTALSGSSEDVAKLSLLRTIVDQNFIIIRELDKIAKK